MKPQIDWCRDPPPNYKFDKTNHLALRIKLLEKDHKQKLTP